MSVKKKILWALLLLISVCGTFLIGGLFGFRLGYAYCVFNRSASEAYITLSALESVNAGNIKSTQDQLELRLDTHIVEHWSGFDNKLFRILPYKTDAVNALMKKVALYRAMRPSKTDRLEVKNCIDEVVARYNVKPN